MNHYEEKQAARRQRLQDRAEAARDASNSAYQRARQMGEIIPLGQPILIGHHSEGRDRRYRAKIDRQYSKSVELSDTADHYEQKAAAVGKGGISSDDPEAVSKLQVQLTAMESVQAKMKAANACVRKNDRAGLRALEFNDEAIDALFTGDYMGRKGFPPYALSNNNATIRRLRDRIKDLEKARERETVAVETERYTYAEDTDENRVMFTFDGKPDDTIRQLLKQHAFNWSPSRGSWVRKLTPAAIYAARRIRETLDAQ